MLTKEQAIDKALEIYHDFRIPEQRRLERIDNALQPKVDKNGFPAPRIELPDDAPEILTKLTVEAETNYLPLLLDTYAQVMIVDNYLTKSQEGKRNPWETWQRNRMDSRQTPLVRSALGYGTSYATALPGEDDLGEPMAATRIFTPKSMTAIYEDEEWDDWPEWALSVTKSRWTLYGPGETHKIRNPQFTSKVVRASPSKRTLEYEGGDEHSLQVAPVVRYRDRHYLPDETILGIIEPLLTVQRRIDRTSANQMIAQQIAIFRQKYIVGWVPENEEDELKASLAKIHYLDMDPSEVEFGEWAATQIDPYLNAGAQGRRDFAAIGQIPSQAMGIDGISNISDATLAGLEAAKNRRAGVITTSLGESHEQLLRLYGTIDGNTDAARDFSSEVIWRDLESRSYGGTIDGLVKLVTSVGLPPEIAMEDVPGMTGQKLKRVQEAMRKREGRRFLEQIRTRGNAQAAQSAEGTGGTPPADTGTTAGGSQQEGVNGV